MQSGSGSFMENEALDFTPNDKVRPKNCKQETELFVSSILMTILI